MTHSTSDHSFSKPVHAFNRFLPFPWFSSIAWVSNFLNIADVSKIPGQMPDRGAVFTQLFTRSKNGDEVFQPPIYLSNMQPDLADKETFMQNSLSPQNLVEVDYSNSSSMYGAPNQSPEFRVRSEPQLNGNANREKVVPLNDASADGVSVDSVGEDARQLAALSSELKFVIHLLADLKAELRVAKEEIRSLHQMEQRTYDRMSQFEQRQQQAEIRRNRLHHSQNQQLERRLQSTMAGLIATALHNAIERIGLARKVRSTAVPEPATKPSTYSVPKRKNTGIYRLN